MQKADVPALLADAPEPAQGADRFQYHLTIDDDSGRQELTAAEDQLPDAIRELIDRVRGA